MSDRVVLDLSPDVRPNHVNVAGCLLWQLIDEIGAGVDVVDHPATVELCRGIKGVAEALVVRPVEPLSFTPLFADLVRQLLQTPVVPEDFRMAIAPIAKEEGTGV